jgi:Asp-tRNA(Asn)/Glu-tRNA(Gln) amidotransferase A subunit family amidase
LYCSLKNPHKGYQRPDPSSRQARQFGFNASVPTGVVDGVPQGVQVIGPYLGDELCLAAATAIEQSLGTFTPIDPVPGPGY